MTREIRTRREHSGVSNRGLIVPLGNSLLNIIWHLEQVPMESFEVVRIPWDSNERGNMCEVGKQ